MISTLANDVGFRTGVIGGVEKVVTIFVIAVGLVREIFNLFVLKMCAPHASSLSGPRLRLLGHYPYCTKIPKRS